jgi:hypothetical protein
MEGSPISAVLPAASKTDTTYISLIFRCVIVIIMELRLSWEGASHSGTRGFPYISWNPTDYSVLTRALHWSLSCAISVKSIPPNSIPWRPILILLSHLCLGLPTGLFPFGSPDKTLYVFLLFPTSVTCPAHGILLGWIILIIFGIEQNLRNCSLCNCLENPITSSLFGPNIILSTPFKNSSYPYSSHPCKNSGKVWFCIF